MLCNLNLEAVKVGVVSRPFPFISVLWLGLIFQIAVPVLESWQRPSSFAANAQ